MEKNISINEWVGKFLRGDFDGTDVQTQINAGWYDWFCEDSSLQSKTEELGKKLIQIHKSKKFNTATSYVWFKNNCPMYGSLYDDFRIADMATGDTIYTIIPAEGYTKTKGQSAVWGKENDFKEPLVTGTWKDVLKFFLG